MAEKDEHGLQTTRRGFCACAALGLAAVAGLGLAGCAGGGGNGAGDSAGEGNAGSTDASGSGTEAPVVQKQEVGDYVLRDLDSVYSDDVEDSVVVMYLTVSVGNAGENTNHTWEEVNSHSKYWYAERGEEPYRCEALLQVGDENGPLPEELGYTALVPNATVTIRGQSSSYYAQKNYKVSLKKDRGAWRGQTTINLNKHEQDGMRFRNKLAFDLLKTIPQTTALRTQFVHLYVKDMTLENPTGLFEDYGLYTQVEQLNKTCLRVHGFDRYGQLYKVEYFEFYRYEDVIKLKTDPTYDVDAFEDILEIKGNDDHSKLIAMLDAVNDYSIPIEETVEKWFDVENIVYWMAFHILVGNYDVQSRNYYLYSPQNLNKFYFMSWDNDVCFTRTEWDVRGKIEAIEWERGISNYWSNVLLSRMMKMPRYVEALTVAVEDLAESYITEERVKGQVERYRNITEAYLSRLPDMLNAPLKQEAYDFVCNEIPKEIEQNRESYYLSLEKPMPFYIDIPQFKDDVLTATWGSAFDFDAEPVTYDAVLARDCNLEDVVKSSRGIPIPLMSVERVDPGQYFLCVAAINESGYTQTAFDIYVDADDQKHYGTLCFYVTSDGEVLAEEPQIGANEHEDA